MATYDLGSQLRFLREAGWLVINHYDYWDGAQIKTKWYFGHRGSNSHLVGEAVTHEEAVSQCVAQCEEISLAKALEERQNGSV